MDDHNLPSCDDSDFLVVAHQIQAPLSAIKWTISMLKNGDAGKLNPEQLELAQKAFDSNDRAIHLIQEVLSASKLQSDKIELSLASVSILDVIHNSIKELSDVAKEKNIRIVIKDVKEELPLVHIDREKIRNAFENLLDNAIKYTNNGGEVIVGVVREEDDVMVYVEDTGIGIPEGDEKKIFAKFYRGDNARSSGIGGTGLGLFITRGIIEKHGGKIWFEDKKRDLHMGTTGARFSFTLPLNNE